jgi:hypothetical protein
MRVTLGVGFRCFQGLTEDFVDCRNGKNCPMSGGHREGITDQVGMGRKMGGWNSGTRPAKSRIKIRLKIINKIS